HLDACRDEAYAVDLLCGRQELTDAITRPRSACLRELAAQIALFLRQLLDATQQRIRRRLEHCRRLLEHRVTCNAAVVRLAARHRFDAADARSHTALAHDAEHADVTRVAHMRAATQFNADRRDRHDTYHVAVLLAEQRHCSACDGVAVGRLLRAHFVIREY